jgi:phosphoglycolate phosphatase
LTLIDTRKATAAGLAAVNTELGETIDIDEFLSRLGMPIRDELARWVPPKRVPAAVEVFRAAFLEDGLHHLTPLPGAVDLTRMVEDRGGRLIVITSRIPPIANAILESCGLKAATVIGDVTGLQKARPIVDHHVEIYIGDHLIQGVARGVALHCRRSVRACYLAVCR